MNCTFCLKPEEQVAVLIVGPEVAICDECVEIAADNCFNILRQRTRRLKEGSALLRHVPKF